MNDEIQQLMKMGLYEVTTSMHGRNVAAFVWAESSEAASRMFFEKNPNLTWESVSFRFLFSPRIDPFCTSFSDCGFGGVRT